MNKKLRFQAHRGVCTEYPESTMAAFQAAVLQQYDFIELDPCRTKDGVWVIHHDETVNRTGRYTDGTTIAEPTPMESLTLDQLERLDFGRFFSDKFAGEKIVTLEKILQFSLEKNIPLKFDNRIGKSSDEARASFFEVLKHIGLHEQSGITCGTLLYLDEVLTHFPSIPVHYDGILDGEILSELRLRKPEGLTVWLPIKNAPAQICAEIKSFAKLGLWLLTTGQQLAFAADERHADIIETDGTLKPEDLENM